jgi:hypothetical protein
MLKLSGINNPARIRVGFEEDAVAKVIYDIENGKYI